MFLSGGPDKRIKDPFFRRIFYVIAIVIFVLWVTPLAYGLFGISGLFVLIPGTVITYIIAKKKKGFPGDYDKKRGNV